MKTKYTLMLLLLATTFAAAAAPIAELETFKFTPDLQKVLAPIETAVWQAKPADRANWEAKLLATLQSSKATVDGKMIILRRLLPAVISEKSVPVVAPLLLDAKLANDARGVLQHAHWHVDALFRVQQHGGITSGDFFICALGHGETSEQLVERRCVIINRAQEQIFEQMRIGSKFVHLVAD